MHANVMLWRSKTALDYWFLLIEVQDQLFHAVPISKVCADRLKAKGVPIKFEEEAILSNKLYVFNAGATCPK